jgi:hypothetical protein
MIIIILLRGDYGSTDVTEVFSLSKGLSKGQTKTDPLKLINQNILYDEVCIDFKSDHLWQWFDVPPKSNKLCRRLADG